MEPLTAAATLSPQDRAKVFQLVSTGDAALADRVAMLLDERDDPIVRLLSEQNSQQASAQRDGALAVANALRSVQDQMRQLMMVMVAVSIVAMCLNAGLVGVSVTLSSRWGNFSVNEKTSAPARSPASSPDPAPVQPDAPQPYPEP